MGMFNITSSYYLNVPIQVKQHFDGNLAMMAGQVGQHQHPALQTDCYLFEPANTLQPQAWATHVVHACSNAAAAILFDIAARSSAGDTTFGSLNIGLAMGAVVQFMGLGPKSTKCRSLDEAMTNQGVTNIMMVTHGYEMLLMVN